MAFRDPLWLRAVDAIGAWPGAWPLPAPASAALSPPPASPGIDRAVSSLIPSCCLRRLLAAPASQPITPHIALSLLRVVHWLSGVAADGSRVCSVADPSGTCDALFMGDALAEHGDRIRPGAIVLVFGASMLLDAASGRRRLFVTAEALVRAWV